jgi:signal transduction histidine kinase
MRLMIFELRPPTLAEDGLVAAIESRLGAVEARAGLTTIFDHDGIDRLPTNLEEALFGIAREALNNVLKHAGASRVHVRLHEEEDALRLVVADDGAGFRTDSGGQSRGLGLAGMEERAERLGLRLFVTSRPGDGTTVTVEVPRPWPERK